MATNKLNAKFCDNAKPGTYFDGEGLYLLIEKNGKKYWRHSTYFQGKPNVVIILKSRLYRHVQNVKIIKA